MLGLAPQYRFVLKLVRSLQVLVRYLKPVQEFRVGEWGNILPKRGEMSCILVLSSHEANGTDI